jgi:hypothetical protein
MRYSPTSKAFIRIEHGPRWPVWTVGYSAVPQRRRCVDRSVPRLGAARVAKCEVQHLVADSSRNSRTPTFGVYGVGSSPSRQRRLRTCSSPSRRRWHHRPQSRRTCPAGFNSATASLTSSGCPRPYSAPRLIPTSDLGRCPLVEYDPAIGLDGAERDLLHHNIQLSCRRTTSLARLRLASPTPAPGRSRCRKRDAPNGVSPSSGRLLVLRRAPEAPRCQPRRLERDEKCHDTRRKATDREWADLAEPWSRRTPRQSINLATSCSCTTCLIFQRSTTGMSASQPVTGSLLIVHSQPRHLRQRRHQSDLGAYETSTAPPLGRQRWQQRMQQNSQGQTPRSPSGPTITVRVKHGLMNSRGVPKGR